MNVYSGGVGSLQMSYFGPNGVTDVAAWMSSINGAQRFYSIGTGLSEMVLNGAHHRPMLSFDRMGQQSQTWATGDFGTSSRIRDSHLTTGEIGMNTNVGKTGLIGVAAGHGTQNDDLALSGSSHTDGNYLLAEYDFRPEGTQWIFSLLGSVGSYDSTINRGYTNGAAVDFSQGKTDLITRALRLRVDAPSIASFAGFSFAPYASYSVAQTIVKPYSETGGAFPASFDEQRHNATEARLGINLTKAISEATTVIIGFEGIHRFDGVGPALTGQDITGGVSFSLPGTAPRADCVRVGLDVDHKLNANTLLNFSMHTSSVGETPDFSTSLSIRRAF